MTSERLNRYGIINRKNKIEFTWNGKKFTGYEGDTLASALMANNVIREYANVVLAPLIVLRLEDR